MWASGCLIFKNSEEVNVNGNVILKGVACVVIVSFCTQSFEPALGMEKRSILVALVVMNSKKLMEFTVIGSSD